MEITPDRIIEEVIDALAMGDLGQAVEAFQFARLGPAGLRLDYGEDGSFELLVRRIEAIP